MGLICGSGRFPQVGNGNQLQCCRLEKFHEQRSLEGYSPWGHRESDTTEQLSVLELEPGDRDTGEGDSGSSQYL